MRFKFKRNQVQMKYELIGVNKYSCTWAGIVQPTLGVLTILFSFKETARFTVLLIIV